MLNAQTEVTDILPRFKVVRDLVLFYFDNMAVIFFFFFSGNRRKA